MIMGSLYFVPLAVRLVFDPECLIDAAHEVLAKTRGKRRARQVEKLADGFQSGLRKRGCDIRIDPQSCERE